MKKLLLALICLVLLSCNKNEFSPVIANQEFSVKEDASNGTIVGVVEASDPDEGQIISYEISDGNSDDIFQINPENGILKVINIEKLDYEENTEYTLTVVVSDNHESEPKESFSEIRISVIDINEYSPEMEDVTFTVNENMVNGFDIGKISATDGDIHQELLFSISSESDYVMINASTGMLSVKDSSAIDFESRVEIVIEVEVSDNQEIAKIAVATIHINILDVLEITDGLVAFFPFNGVIDELYIYNRVINQDEINTLYSE